MSEVKKKILVWDAPTRVFHGLMVVCFLGAYATSEGSGVLAIHLTLGYTMVGLVTFRVVWGLIGTRYARFGNFVRGTGAMLQYTRAMFNPSATHPVGHNPLGAVSIVLMLLCTLLIACSGWLYDSSGAHWLKGLHEGAAALLAGVVSVHLAGVVFASLMQRENLARAMVSGHKQGHPDQAIRWNWWPLAVLMLVAVLGYWWLQWQSPSTSADGGGFTQKDGQRRGEGERDDD